MNSRSRRRHTAWWALAIVLVAQLWLDVRMVPDWIREARWRWNYFQTRNNPPCHQSKDCLSFATEHCLAPGFMVICFPYDAGVCRCGEDEDMTYFNGSVSVPVELKNLEYDRLHGDAGAEASP